MENGEEEVEMEDMYGEYEDEEDDMYEYLDEYGQPIPPHLVKQYKEQMRLRNEGDEEYDMNHEEEEFDDDFDEDNDDVEYVDEEGNVIPKEVIIQYRNERK